MCTKVSRNLDHCQTSIVKVKAKVQSVCFGFIAELHSSKFTLQQVNATLA